MTVTAVSFYNVVLWLHITAVVVGFGGTFAYGVIIQTAMRKHPRSLPGVLAGVNENSRILVNAGAGVVLLTGIYLAADRWGMGDFFVTWGFIAILALFGLMHAVFNPSEKQALAAAERDVAASPPDGDVRFSPQFESASKKLATFGPIAGIIIVLTIYVMSAKPFL